MACPPKNLARQYARSHKYTELISEAQPGRTSVPPEAATVRAASGAVILEVDTTAPSQRPAAAESRLPAGSVAPVSPAAGAVSTAVAQNSSPTVQSASTQPATTQPISSQPNATITASVLSAGPSLTAGLHTVTPPPFIPYSLRPTYSPALGEKLPDELKDLVGEYQEAGYDFLKHLFKECEKASQYKTSKDDLGQISELRVDSYTTPHPELPRNPI